MDDTALFRLIGSISRQATSDVNQQVRSLGLANNLFIYLMRIVEHEDLTQAELVHLTRIDKTTLSRALGQLESRGYIVRVPDARDRKFKHVQPTNKAKLVYPQIRALEQGYVDRAMSGLSADQRQELQVILNQIDLNLQ